MARGQLKAIDGVQPGEDAAGNPILSVEHSDISAGFHLHAVRRPIQRVLLLLSRCFQGCRLLPVCGRD
jgi:hypothetical protein